MRKIRKTNHNLVALTSELKKKSIEEQVGIWKRIAEDLEKPTRLRKIVNLSNINRYSDNNDVVLVPGKVLASGLLEKKLTVAAFNFSQDAREKIEKAGGKAITISQLYTQNPKGKDVKIIA